MTDILDQTTAKEGRYDGTIRRMGTGAFWGAPLGDRRRVRRLDEPGLYLIIEDTTTLDYHTLQACEGLGPIGESYTRGFWLHSALAVRLEQDGGEDAWSPGVVGLFDQQAWARQGVIEDRGTKSDQLSRGRESQRWARALERHKRKRSSSIRWVYVAGRRHPAGGRDIGGRGHVGGVGAQGRPTVEGMDRRVASDRHRQARGVPGP